MKTLNLHGVRHHEADEIIRSFLNFVELPCEIITGNSSTMKTIVQKITKEYGWFCREKNSYNPGALILTEKEII